MPIAPNVRRMPSKTSTAAAYKYDNLPEDTYQVEITDIEHSVGPNKFKDDGNEYDWLKFTFTVLTDEEFEGDHNGKQSSRGRRQWLPDVKWSMSPPGDYPASKLYRIASAANGGKVFNKQECNTFDPNTLIGKQLRIVVKEKPGKTQKTDDDGNLYTPYYNNITDFMNTKRLMTPFDPDTEGFAAKSKVTQLSDEDMSDLPF